MQRKNDATKQVIKHADMMIKLVGSGAVPKQEMVFDFGKRKQKAPLESFTAYYLYKTEEMENAKRLLRKQQLEASSGGIGNEEEAYEEDRVVLSPREIFSKYVSDNHFSDPDRFISEEQYLRLDFTNQIPEIVCEILCYLANYYHYYTPLCAYKTYKSLMDAQIKDKSVASAEQAKLIEE